MKCLDTRWQEATKTVMRRHACDCGVRGRSTERWDSLPTAPQPKPSQPKHKKLSVERATDALWDAMNKPTKKQKDVAVKHKPPKSMFEDTEDYSYGDRYDDIGIDIPKGDDW